MNLIEKGRFGKCNNFTHSTQEQFLCCFCTIFDIFFAKSLSFLTDEDNDTAMNVRNRFFIILRVAVNGDLIHDTIRLCVPLIEQFGTLFLIHDYRMEQGAIGSTVH